MSNAIITNSTLEDIADAIRAKTGSSDTMLPSEMAGKISNIPSGSSGWTLVWTNDSPGNAFSAQTVQINLSSYSKVMIKGKVGRGTVSTTPSVYSVQQVIDINGTTYDVIMGSDQGTGSIYDLTYRKISASSTGVTFSTGYQRHSTSQTTGTGYGIPTHIYAM